MNERDESMNQSINDKREKENGFVSRTWNVHFSSAPLWGGVRIFSSEKATKFGPFEKIYQGHRQKINKQIFQRCREKNKHFGLHFSNGADKNLRV